MSRSMKYVSCLAITILLSSSTLAARDEAKVISKVVPVPTYSPTPLPTPEPTPVPTPEPTPIITAKPKPKIQDAPIVAVAPGSARALGQQMNAEKGWAQHWSSLDALWTHESGWSTVATNPSSGACGIPQRHPCPKGYKNLPAEQQIADGLNYIAHRYGNPSNAYAHFKRKNWYNEYDNSDDDRISNCVSSSSSGSTCVDAT